MGVRNVGVGEIYQRLFVTGYVKTPFGVDQHSLLFLLHIVVTSEKFPFSAGQGRSDELSQEQDGNEEPKARLDRAIAVRHLPRSVVEEGVEEEKG